MSKKRCEITQRFAAIIPYDDLENLLEAAQKIEDLEKKYQHMEKKYIAMLQLYREVLEKVNEINRYL